MLSGGFIEARPRYCLGGGDRCAYPPVLSGGFIEATTNRVELTTLAAYPPVLSGGFIEASDPNRSTLVDYLPYPPVLSGGFIEAGPLCCPPGPGQIDVSPGVIRGLP